MKGQTLLLGLGWLAQSLFWISSLVRAGRDAAEPGEYLREIVIRASMLVLIILALVMPRGRLFGYGHGPAFAGIAVFLLGQVLAIWARLQLGDDWGVGVSPRAGGPSPGKNGRSKVGMYGVVRHPIYLGTILAVTAQSLLLQNAPSLVLFAGAVFVVLWKSHEEDRRFGLPDHESRG